jgi:hypothetical protein
LFLANRRHQQDIRKEWEKSEVPLFLDSLPGGGERRCWLTMARSFLEAILPSGKALLQLLDKWFYPQCVCTSPFDTSDQNSKGCQCFKQTDAFSIPSKSP